MSVALAYDNRSPSFMQRIYARNSPFFDIGQLQKCLGISKRQLSNMIGVHRNSLNNNSANKVQRGILELVKIITTAERICGDTEKAIFWFRNEPIASYKNMTPLELLADGRRDLVIEQLYHIENGSYQ